jgi:hypothetical protein
MVARMLFAAILGALIGGAELVGRYQDKPAAAVFSPSGLLYIAVNASASTAALIAAEAMGWGFALPDGAPAVGASVAQVMAAAVGAAAIFRSSFMIAQDKGVSIGPILLLSGLLKIVDAAMDRKRALSRLSTNDLAGLSFANDHAALAELCSHAIRRYELSEAQRLGELAADLRSRDDLTDADKLDCFGLELSRLVGERALRKAAERLRDRPEAEETPAPAAAAVVEEVVPAVAAEEETDFASRMGGSRRLARRSEY